MVICIGPVKYNTCIFGITKVFVTAEKSGNCSADVWVQTGI